MPVFLIALEDGLYLLWPAVFSKNVAMTIVRGTADVQLLATTLALLRQIAACDILCARDGGVFPLLTKVLSSAPPRAVRSGCSRTCLAPPACGKNQQLERWVHERFMAHLEGPFVTGQNRAGTCVGCATWPVFRGTHSWACIPTRHKRHQEVIG